MDKRFSGIIFAITFMAAVESFSVPAFGQAPAAPGAPAPAGAPAAARPNGGRGGGGRGGYQPPTGPAPRMADGKVDFSGNWAPNAINQNVDLAKSLCGDKPVPCGDPPMLPWAEKLYLQRKGDISKDDPEGFCLPPGVPRMSTTPYPWTMVQTDKLLVIVYEGGAHIWRKIFLDGRAHNP